MNELLTVFAERTKLGVVDGSEQDVSECIMMAREFAQDVSEGQRLEYVDAFVATCVATYGLVKREQCLVDWVKDFMKVDVWRN